MIRSFTRALLAHTLANLHTCVSPAPRACLCYPSFMSASLLVHVRVIIRSFSRYSSFMCTFPAVHLCDISRPWASLFTVHQRCLSFVCTLSFVYVSVVFRSCFPCPSLMPALSLFHIYVFSHSFLQFPSFLFALSHVFPLFRPCLRCPSLMPPLSHVRVRACVIPRYRLRFQDYSLFFFFLWP